ncbi:uncharacterized protein KY384_002025 [Bacidia gigantensis]|uniref:uncharacterized protein n=1 Tax=Bacidia gigantensis TaxID=2732470 RepID=UPI001D057A55|nr:uncharacterized protein KY384_002025 [Bacidia gigantensis]KAG8533242.1 hypothetical protein KY384_002025 [Bacidia gigantensis]
MTSSRDMSPASSQLSSHGSSEFAEDVKTEDADSGMDVPPEPHLLPPSKRRRVGVSSPRSTPIPPIDNRYEEDQISSDTDGSIPTSPSGDQFNMMPDEDPRSHLQVRVCRWDGCEAGDLNNMDNLVEHLHLDHIGSKETNYACEWMDCTRKGTPHASGYALKAHMRSHTKEKPFYCALPECDRSFTRSDALAKHMRTVHETEALRPSDPVPRNYNSAHFKPQRLKLILNAKPPTDTKDGNGETLVDDDATLSHPSDTENGTALPYDYPLDVTFTDAELAIRPDQLFRLLRRQLAWSEEDNKLLAEEVQELEKKRRDEWMAKELVLANVMEAELAVAHGKGEDESKIMRIVTEDLPGEPLPLQGKEIPWYRKTVDDGEDGMEGMVADVEGLSR